MGLEGLPHDQWPRRRLVPAREGPLLPRGARTCSSEQTDGLLAEANKLAKKLGGGRPARLFVFTDLRKWAPAWSVPAKGDTDEEEVSKEIRELAKARIGSRSYFVLRGISLASARQAMGATATQKKRMLSLCQWQLAWHWYAPARAGLRWRARVSAQLLRGRGRYGPVDGGGGDRPPQRLHAGRGEGGVKREHMTRAWRTRGRACAGGRHQEACPPCHLL